MSSLVNTLRRCHSTVRAPMNSCAPVPPSGLKPHDDLLAEFPYLGPPNP